MMELPRRHATPFKGKPARECSPGSLGAARVRGLCTLLVTKSGAVADCQSWHKKKEG